MNLLVERYFDLKKISYKISNNIFHGYTNYTYGILPIKIKLCGNDMVCELKQKSYLLKLINCLPILNSETFTPFKIYTNSECIGNSKKIPFNPAFLFYVQNEVFELRQHNNNYISLMRNNVQIALYQKKDLSIKERNIYSVLCIERSDKLPWIILFCLFADIVFYANDRRASFVKYEKNFVFNDKYSERVSWRP